MPRQAEISSSDSESDAWLTILNSDNSTSALPAQRPSRSSKPKVADSQESANTTQPAKAPKQPKAKRTPLEDYFHEQSKLFSSLQKRYDQFQERAAEERGKKKPVKSKVQAKPAKAAQTAAPDPSSAKGKRKEEVKLLPITSVRYFSSSPVSSAALAAPSRKKRATVNPDAMSLTEATRVLRALEISNPTSAYSVTLTTRTSKSSAPLRGRLALPTDPRKAPEIILVFADPSSPSAELAKAAGAAHVGGEELFPLLLNGEIVPTKCLATPGMMPAVAKSMARFLGPKGLMPVAKRGGVGEGEELAKRVKEAAGGMEWKGDKAGVVRAPVARMSFPLDAVNENVRAFISAVKDGSASAAASAADSSSRKRPPSGIISARLETTQGPSIELNDVL